MVSRLLAHGRDAAEALMLDTCRITRDTGGWTVDPETGEDIPARETVYEGRCKMTSTPQAGDRRETEMARFTVESPRLHLPINSPVRSGDRAVIIESDTDSANTELDMALIDLNRGTHRTAQRWSVEVTTR